MKIETEIDDQILEDLFITAFEGGSSYWAEVQASTPKQKKGECKSPSERWFEHIMNGGSMEIWDAENPDELLGTMTLESIQKGTALYINGGFPLEDGDAADADAWFQYCLIGEIVYG